MYRKMQLLSLVSAIFLVAWLSAANADTADGRKNLPPPQSVIVKVDLPASDETFPAGVGAEIAGSQCQICHSAGMVLTQPPLKKGEWRTEILKMRTAYGAPIPEDQVEVLSEYLKNINGRE